MCVQEEVEKGDSGFCLPYEMEKGKMKDPATGEWRLWYDSYGDRKCTLSGTTLHVARSRDGLHWEKPNLGIADFQGSRDNNLLVDFDSPRFGTEFFAYNNVIRDAHDPDPARRYKALGFWLRFDGTGYGMLVAFSPDGSRLVAVAYGNLPKIWDPKTGRELV